MLHRTKVVLGVCALSGVAGVGAACVDEGEQIVFVAQMYDETNQCFGDYVPVGTYRAKAAPLDCAPACVTIGTSLYVTTGCPPYPPNATLGDPDASPCCAALASYDGGVTCSAGAAGADASGEAGPDPDGGNGDGGGGGREDSGGDDGGVEGGGVQDASDSG